jgi:hypothetical protein
VCDGRWLEAAVGAADGVAGGRRFAGVERLFRSLRTPAWARTAPPGAGLSCQMGLVLHAPAEVAPTPGELFLVVDATLRVGAVAQWHRLGGPVQRRYLDPLRRTARRVLLPRRGTRLTYSAHRYARVYQRIVYL